MPQLPFLFLPSCLTAHSHTQHRHTHPLILSIFTHTHKIPFSFSLLLPSLQFSRFSLLSPSATLSLTTWSPTYIHITASLLIHNTHITKITPWYNPLNFCINSRHTQQPVPTYLCTHNSLSCWHPHIPSLPLPQSACLNPTTTAPSFSVRHRHCPHCTHSRGTHLHHHCHERSNTRHTNWPKQQLSCNHQLTIDFHQAHIYTLHHPAHTILTLTQTYTISYIWTPQQ